MSLVSSTDGDSTTRPPVDELETRGSLLPRLHELNGRRCLSALHSPKFEFV